MAKTRRPADSPRSRRTKSSRPPPPRPRRATPQAASNRPKARLPVAGVTRLTIVGIGASAGGIEAVGKLLQNLAPDTGLAFVLVQHLAPDHESFLAEVLTPTSRIPVVTAAAGMPIKANRLHVIPPNAHMTVTDGHLHLGPRPHDRSQFNPIDMFFSSLAEHAAGRSVGVVLSGSASDGAIGLREIKEAGGLAIVQDPKTARYDSMPRAAIAAGAVDLVLPPEAIADELVKLGAHPLTTGEQRRGTDLGISKPQWERLFYLLRTASGVDFTHYRLPTIKRRLQRRMTLHKLTEADQYLKILQADSGEIRNLYRDLLIHVTRFFRDPESFHALQQTVFPAIVAEGPKLPVRIWVPGCATGEEAYSIAIAFFEFLGEEATSTPLQVFATDVSEEAIERARAGVYPESIVADVSAERLRRFFTRVDGDYRVSKIVRDSCVFARQDLTRDPPFSKLDLIVCRNVLIYLGPQLQRRLMSVFHYALKPSGFLVLGSTETVGGSAELFAVIDRRKRIYTRRNGRVRAEFELPVALDSSDRTGMAKRAAHVAAGQQRADLNSEATRLLLTRYAPPAVVIDGDFQILQTRGRTGAFLELSVGEASLNLLKMAREGMLHALRSALDEARKSGKPARRERLTIRRNGRSGEVDLQVIPFGDRSDATYYLVTFEEPMISRLSWEQADAKTSRRARTDGPKVKRLQQELSSNREYLQSIIQDLEAANEELQSANEEILSSNEELQSMNEELDTTKEELQSANEELNTVNEQLNARNEELSQSNSDLLNLLAGVPAAVVMVTSDLRIRRFTPLAEQLLNLIPSDAGRPLSDIKPNIDVSDLDEITREVIETVAPNDRQVRDRSGHVYLLRIRPYKNQENRIDGAVLSLISMPQQS